MSGSDQHYFLDSKDQITFSEINALTESVGWGKSYFNNEEQWIKTLTTSSYIAYRREDEKLVCFGRILEDGQMCMFYDICVHPNYQKKNLGSLLMEHLIDKIKDKNYVSVGLFVWGGNPTATEFYKKFGFKCAPAMELKKHMKKV